MKDDTIAARLEIIAAKARILASNYKGGALWPGDLSRGLDEIEAEMNRIRSESSYKSSHYG